MTNATTNDMTWDPSVLGVTAADMAEMSADEQRERAVDEINRAADLLQAIVAAFGVHMNEAQRATLSNCAASSIRVARTI